MNPFRHLGHASTLTRRFSAVIAVVLVVTSITLGTGAGRATAVRAALRPPSLAYGAVRTLLSGPAGPKGIAADSSGDVFMVYASVAKVVEVPRGGTQTVLPFTNLHVPDGVAVDGAGDVLVADVNEVVKLTPGGTQSVLPFTGIGGFITGIAVDSSGDVFVSDADNNRVVMLTPGGLQTTVPFAGLDRPFGLAVDAVGDLFVVDFNHALVRERLSGGIQRSIRVAGQSFPTDVAADAAGNVFVSAGFPAVVKVAPGGEQTVLAFPIVRGTGVAVDAAGDVWVADNANSLVWELPVGASAVRFPANSLVSLPNGLAADSAGDLFVADFFGGVVELPHNGVPVLLPITGLDHPTGVAVDVAGDVFVADTYNDRVVKLPKGGTQVVLPFHDVPHPMGVAVDAAGDVFVTTGLGPPEVVELPVGASQVVLPLKVARPVGVAVDGDGNVFVADGGEEFDGIVFAAAQLVELPHGGVQTTIPVAGLTGFSAVAVDHAGDLFVAGFPPAGYDDLVVEFPKGAGPGSEIGIPITSPLFPAMTVDDAGDVFFGEQNSNVVRELPLDQAVFVNPVNGQLNVNTSQPFTWSTIAAAQGYRLIVGTTPGGHDLVDSGILPPSQSTFDVPALPSGPVLYATLFTEGNGTSARNQVIGFTAKLASPVIAGPSTTVLATPPSSVPGLALTGENTSIPLAAAGSLMILGLSGLRRRRRLGANPPPPQ